MKKILIAILVMNILLLQVVFAAKVPSQWAEKEIEEARKNNLITEEVTKDYQSNITRENFCELVVKLYEKLTGEKAQLGKDIFEDTDNKEILKAYNLGIVKGISESEFAPKNTITRQEICVMLTRCIDVGIEKAEITKYNENTFSDEEEIAQWAKEAVKYAYDKEIVKGVGDNKIDPLGNATCEQAIMLVNRIYKNRAYLRETENTVYELKEEAVSQDKETGIKYINNIVLVFFEDTATEEEKNELVKELDGKVVGKLETINQYQIEVEGRNLEELKELCEKIKQKKYVLEAMYDLAVQINPDSIVEPQDGWKDSWNEEEPEGENEWLEIIQAPSAWQYNDKLSKIKIGVVDSGFYTEHEDLKGRISFPGKYEELNVLDGHGTHVAGIIGAIPNNNKGITGIVWNSELICFNWHVHSEHELVTENMVMTGLVETVKSGAKVINYSMGTYLSSEEEINQARKNCLNAYSNFIGSRI